MEYRRKNDPEIKVFKFQMDKGKQLWIDTSEFIEEKQQSVIDVFNAFIKKFESYFGNDMIVSDVSENSLDFFIQYKNSIKYLISLRNIINGKESCLYVVVDDDKLKVFSTEEEFLKVYDIIDDANEGDICKNQYTISHDADKWYTDNSHEYDILLTELTAKYTIHADCCDNEDDGIQQLVISNVDEGGGDFFRLTTGVKNGPSYISVDSELALKDILDDFKKRLNMKNFYKINVD